MSAFVFMFVGFKAELQTLLRLCARALLLAVLATVRGVYVVLEQPNSSAMKWYPDLVGLKEALNSAFCTQAWQDHFLSETQNQSLRGFYPGLPFLYVSKYALSWMGAFGARTLKPSRLFGTAPGAQYQEVLAKMTSTVEMVLWPNSCLSILITKILDGQFISKTVPSSSPFSHGQFQEAQSGDSEGKGRWFRCGVSFLVFRYLSNRVMTVQYCSCPFAEGAVDRG